MGTKTEKTKTKTKSKKKVKGGKSKTEKNGKGVIIVGGRVKHPPPPPPRMGDSAGRKPYHGLQDVRSEARHQVASVGQKPYWFSSPVVTIKPLAGLGPDFLSEHYREEAEKRERMRQFGEKSNFMNLMKLAKDLPVLKAAQSGVLLHDDLERARNVPARDPQPPGRNPQLGPPPILKPVPIEAHSVVQQAVKENHQAALRARQVHLGNISAAIEQTERRITGIMNSLKELANHWEKLPGGFTKGDADPDEAVKVFRVIYPVLNNSHAYKRAIDRVTIPENRLITVKNWRAFIHYVLIFHKFYCIFGDFDEQTDKVMDIKCYEQAMAKLGVTEFYRRDSRLKVCDIPGRFHTDCTEAKEMSVFVFLEIFLEVFGDCVLEPLTWATVDKKTGAVKVVDFLISPSDSKKGDKGDKAKNLKKSKSSDESRKSVENPFPMEGTEPYYKPSSRDSRDTMGNSELEGRVSTTDPDPADPFPMAPKDRAR